MQLHKIFADDEQPNAINEAGFNKTMTKSKKEYPYCFAKLDHVFPLGKDGLRHTPESCMVCFCKTECLREAVKGPEGIQVHEERVKRAYNSGTISFFERWSRKKALKLKKKSDKK